MRPQSWTLAQEKDQTWTVLRGNKLLHHGLTPQAAQQLVIRSRVPGERVFHAEPDGYLTEVTPKGHRHPPADRAAEEPVDPQRPDEPVTRRTWPRHEWSARVWTSHGQGALSR
jgi:hypothetical protein